MTVASFDREVVMRAARLLVEPGGITELRAMDAALNGDRRTGTVSGYFDSPAKLAGAVRQITTAKGIYIIPNAMKPALLARANNRIRIVGKGDPLTSDHDITQRLWLLLDLDPERPSGIGSTDAEHAAARACAERVREYLRGEGWPEPILADSGNGWHLLYRIALPTEDGGLVACVLMALAARFDGEGVKVDTSVHNPARIWKLYGTVARKGDAMPNRPHRMSRLVDVPDSLEVVPESMLVALGGTACASSPARSTTKGASSPFDLTTWMQTYIPQATGPESWQGGEIWKLPICPFNDNHTGACAFVGRLPSGAITAGCHHNSCQHWGWKELRAKIEPPSSRRPPARNDANNRPVLVQLSSVQPEVVSWLWPGRFALGKLTLIAGDPGLGKSFLTSNLWRKSVFGPRHGRDRGVAYTSVSRQSCRCYTSVAA